MSADSLTNTAGNVGWSQNRKTCTCCWAGPADKGFSWCDACYRASLNKGDDIAANQPKAEAENATNDEEDDVGTSRLGLCTVCQWRRPIPSSDLSAVVSSCAGRCVGCQKHGSAAIAETEKLWFSAILTHNTEFFKSKNKLPVPTSFNETGRTLLGLAAELGYADIVRRLIELKVDLNTQSLPVATVGKTALHYATLHDRMDVVRELLKARAKVDIRDARGYLPMDYAATPEVQYLVRTCPTSVQLDSALTEVSKNVGALWQTVLFPYMRTFTEPSITRVELDPGTPEFAAIQRILQLTIVPQPGKKLRHIPTSFLVEQIEVLRNGPVWQQWWRSHTSKRSSSQNTRSQLESYTQTAADYFFTSLPDENSLTSIYAKGRVPPTVVPWSGAERPAVRVAKHSTTAYGFHVPNMATKDFLCTICGKELSSPGRDSRKCIGCGVKKVSSELAALCIPCDKVVCQTCLKKRVADEEPWRFLLLCIVDTGRVNRSEDSHADAYSRKNEYGLDEIDVFDPARVYPCYIIKCKAQFAL